MYTPSFSHSSGSRNTLAAAALAVAGAFGVTDAQAETQKHKGIMATVGTTVQAIRGYVTDLDYDPVNPANSKATTTEAYNKSVSQFDEQTGGHSHFFSGRSLLTKEFASKTSGNKEGIHIYYDLGNGKKFKSNVLLDSSNVDEFDYNDTFYLSAGTTPDKDQVIALNGGKIKTYDMVRDAAQKVTGLKLVGKTDATKDFGIFTDYSERVWKDMHVTTYRVYNEVKQGSEYGFQLRKKDPKGLWGLVYDKKPKDAMKDWGYSDSSNPYPIIDAQNSNMEMSIFNPDAEQYVVYNVIDGNKTADQIPSSSLLRRFGENNQYKIYEDKNTEKYVVLNAKGEKVSLTVDVILSGHTHGFYTLDDQTYLTYAGNQLLFLRVTENPFKVESFVIPSGMPAAGYGSLQFMGRDPDKDRVSHFTDNCPDAPNTSQHDENGNGIGDPCDASPAKLGDINYANQKTLPNSGYRILYSGDAASTGPWQLKATTNGTSDTILPSLTEQSGVKFWILANKTGALGVINLIIPAGYTLDFTAFDGAFMLDGKPVKGPITAEKELLLTTTPFSNIQGTLKNNGAPVPVEPQPESAPDLGGEVDGGGSGDVDAGPTSDSDAQGEVMGEVMGEVAPPDAANDNMDPDNGGNNDASPTDGQGGSDAQDLGAPDAAGPDMAPRGQELAGSDAAAGLDPDSADAKIGLEAQADARKVTPPKTTLPPPKNDGCAAFPTSSSEQCPMIPAVLLLSVGGVCAVSRRRVREVTLARSESKVV